MSKVQTDNSYLEAKIKLRIETIANQIKNKSINILDLYGGEGKIWNEIKTRTNWNLNILRIDLKSNRRGIYLKGDNLKFLSKLNLEDFQIIDCDAYGIPYKQLKQIFQKNYKGIIFITYIQSMYGKLPTAMLNELGYTKIMIKKIPTLFNTNGLEKLKAWLSLHGITIINIISFNRKHYLSINMRQQ